MLRWCSMRGKDGPVRDESLPLGESEIDTDAEYSTGAVSLHLRAHQVG